jgi:hypothetical protein
MGLIMTGYINGPPTIPSLPNGPEVLNFSPKSYGRLNSRSVFYQRQIKWAQKSLSEIMYIRRFSQDASYAMRRILLAAQFFEIATDLRFRLGGNALAFDGLRRLLIGPFEGAADFS